MKKIEAIIKPFELEEVKRALKLIGIDELTASEVRDIGGSATRTEVFQGSEYTMEFQQMTKLDLVVEDAVVDKAVDAIFDSATHGNCLAAKVFVSSVEKAVRIATGEISR